MGRGAGGCWWARSGALDSSRAPASHLGFHLSHDLFKSIFYKDMSEVHELLRARGSAGAAVLVAGYFGINPPDYVAAVVAFAFGLAAASFSPCWYSGSSATA